jgi:hypothetical protein
VLRWLRGFYVKPLPLLALVVVLVLIAQPEAWTWALLGVSALVWLQGAISLSLRIRREERRERD